ncbi:MAG: response regulator transcription factor [Hydrogenophaga sp.]|uniref:response regulator transcription factor n=1 Tax=Hydrogenophaga sp. TaxID=1904254 RepID=UPI001DB63578|nr:response regulator transcription factor [Hydrogenophaga sp.]MBX3610505.1 response regulator transcription factor [Hydrogenophaga sp.]
MKLLLIDDQPIFAAGLAHALGEREPGIEVASARCLADAFAQIAAQPDVELVLVDHRPGKPDGVEVLARIGATHPWLVRVLMSSEENRALQLRARQAGAAGFVGKSLSVDGMLSALKAVRAGGTHFPHECFPHECDAQMAAPSSLVPTSRQREVLDLVSRGLPNKRIASQLGIAERTVKLHVAALLDRLQAHNRTHLLLRAREHGLL